MYSKLTDHTLFEKIQKDDVRAFEQLYKKYHSRMFIYSKKFISDTEIAKDLLQEVYTDIWDKRGNLTIKVSVSALLFKMLHNKCIDHLRLQTIQNNFESISSLRLAEMKYQFYHFEEDPFASIFVGEINNIIDKTLSDLPEQIQEIFRMSRVKGMKNSEIAEELNLSVRTVENNIYQTLKILKKQLADYAPHVIFIL